MSWLLALCAIAMFSITESEDLILPALGVLAQLWSAPMTILAGITYYKDDFPMFRPFKGGSMFVMMQSIGWTLYAFSGIFAFLLLANSPMPRIETMGLAILGFSANSILNLSLDKLSVDSKKIMCERKISPKSPRGRKRSISAGSIAKQLAEENFKSNILRVFPYGLVCSMLSLLLCIFTDFFYRPSRTELIIYVTAFVTVIGAFATHILSADLESFFPFSGGFEYRLLQAIGWLGVGSVGYSALSIAPEIASPQIRGALTIYGAFGLVSNIIILWSFEFYDLELFVDETDDTSSVTRSPRHHLGFRYRLYTYWRTAKKRLTLKIAIWGAVIWIVRIISTSKMIRKISSCTYFFCLFVFPSILYYVS